MSKLFTDGGFLSDKGQKVFAQHLDKEVSALLQTAESESELRLIASLIMQRVSSLASDYMVSKKKTAQSLQSMTDKEFYDFLKVKYGSDWMLVSLTLEEFDRLPKLSKEEMDGAMEKGRKERDAAMAATPSVIINPDLRFR